MTQLRQVLDEIDNNDAQVIVELPGTYRPVVGVSIRLTPEHGTQLVVVADL